MQVRKKKKERKRKKHEDRDEEKKDVRKKGIVRADQLKGHSHE